ncbi:unnamed protein product, partial [Pneumocystis jirovecii]
AQLAECINVLKSGKYAKIGCFFVENIILCLIYSLGDEIVVVIQKARSSGLSAGSQNINKVQRGDIKHALVVRTKKETRRKDGKYIRFDDNACILINKKEPIGTRILGSDPRSAVTPTVSLLTVDQISCLTLKETAELVSQLKIHLNIQDIAPVVTSVPLSTSEPVHQENDEEKEEKRLFNVTLESYDPAAKAKVIKEIKSILGLNLVESKKFVESSPKMLKEGVNKEDADKIKKTFEDL